MDRRPLTLLRAMAAAFAIFLVTVAVPVALVKAVGWPLPTSLPTAEEIAAGLDQRGIADSTIVKALAIVVWVAWAQLTLALAAEVVALVRNRRARLVPAAAPVRRLAAALVSAVAVVVPVGGAMARPVAVAPGDSLWSIAERELGEGERWPELWDVNEGRVFGKRTFNDPSLVLPGWTLEVPDRQARQPGESLPLATSRAPETSSEASAATPAGALPGGADAASASSGAVCVPAAGGVDSPPVGVAAAATAPEQPGMARRAVGPATSVILATGIAGLVAFQRRRRVRSLAPAESLAPVPARLVPLAEAVQRASDSAFVARLDLTMRVAARRLSVESARVAVALRHGDHSIELLGTKPLPPAAEPFQAGHSGWLLAPTVPTTALVSLAGGTGMPTTPALVQLGRTKDGLGVFADLEAMGVLAVAAPAERADAVARAVVATLSVSPLADDVDVVSTGMATPVVGPANRVEQVATADELLEILALRSASLTAQLDQVGAPTLLAARLAGPDGWPVTVGVVGSGAIAEDLAPGLVSVPRCGALVVAGDVPAAPWRLVDTGANLELEPIGISIEPSLLSRFEMTEVAEVIEVAGAPAELVCPTATVAGGPAIPDHRIVIQVLGPVAVVDRDGRAATFERAKALELLVWLALHRSNPSRLGARTALWDVDVRDATFANVVSEARRGLARLVPPPEGTEWVARSHSDRIPLHDLVVTDADLLRAHVDRARGQSRSDAIATLRDGLGLVRDQPFSGTAFSWPDAEAIPSGLVVLATSAAARLAGLALDEADSDTAFWATGVGLRVLPGHEELVCLRMEAHALAGDLSGVRSEYSSYERAVLGDSWSDGAVGAKVVATRHRLLEQGAVATRGRARG